jgi:hypothetical protein
VPEGFYCADISYLLTTYSHSYSQCIWCSLHTHTHTHTRTRTSWYCQLNTQEPDVYRPECASLVRMCFVLNCWVVKLP